jgi:predicted transcriptional regulator of viral defense system
MRVQPAYVDSPHHDEQIADLAERQHTIVDARDLRAIGLDRHAVEHRRKVKRLHPVFRGVYSVSPILSDRARWMAAVRAVRRSVLSHFSAAVLIGLLPGSGAPVPHVTAVRTSGRQRRGLRIHPVPELHPDDVTEVDGIPCTTWARTLVDLGSVLSPSALAAAAERAVVLGLFDLVQLEAAIERQRVRIDQQLRRIESMTRCRVVGAVGAQTVPIAGDDIPNEAMKDVAGALR